MIDAWRTKAAEDVLSERARQIEGEGWTPEHDDEHSWGELANAAAAYAVAARLPDTYHKELPPSFWPWPNEAWKPAGRRRMLIKAGALIIAEIERLDRIDAEIKTMKPRKQA